MKLLTDEQTNGGKKHKLLAGGNHIIFTQNNDNVCEKKQVCKERWFNSYKIEIPHEMK